MGIENGKTPARWAETSRPSDAARRRVTEAEKRTARLLRDLILSEVSDCGRIATALDLDAHRTAEYIEVTLRRTFAALAGKPR